MKTIRNPFATPTGTQRVIRAVHDIAAAVEERAARIRYGRCECGMAVRGYHFGEELCRADWDERNLGIEGTGPDGEPCEDDNFLIKY